MKKDGEALLVIPGAGGEGAEPEAEAAPEASDEDALAANAFQALKDDDEEGFKRSFKAAVRACVDSYGEE